MISKAEFRARMDKAFKGMRRRGLIARRNYLCCRSCAGAQITTDHENMSQAKREKIKGACYYCRQTEEHFKRGAEGMYLSFGALADPLTDENVGVIVVEELKRAGLVVEWDGNAARCIHVSMEEPASSPEPVQEFLSAGEAI